MLVSTDRRVKKTRQSLQGALIALMVERGYDNVTVQHLLDKAGVGRSTFYAHFKSKEELLVSSLLNMQAGLLHNWKAEIAAGKERGKLVFVLPFLRHIDGQRHIWRAVVGGESGRIVDRHFRMMLSEMARKDLAVRKGAKNATELAVTCVVGSLMSLIEAWMDGAVSGSAVEINETFLRMTLPGLDIQVGVLNRD